MSLAARLVGAEAAMLRAERDLEMLLDSVYLGVWDDFEFDAAHAIDVFGVTPSDAAVDALLRAGFSYIGQHEHSIAQFTGREPRRDGCVECHRRISQRSC